MARLFHTCRRTRGSTSWPFPAISTRRQRRPRGLASSIFPARALQPSGTRAGPSSSRSSGQPSSVPAGSTPPDLKQSYLFTSAGHLTPLHTGTTYQTSLFPIPLRVRVPTPGWSGCQWKSGSDYFRGGGPPNYGWVHFARGSTTGPGAGLISIMTAYTRKPSVARTVNVLRTRGHGATYEPTSPVTLAGFTGIQVDSRITGAKNFDHTVHYFTPFSPVPHAAKYSPDEYGVYGDVFRVLVLDVRGK